MSSTVSHVQPKNKLAKDFKIAEIIKHIETKTEALLQDINLKIDPEFITYLLNIVENLVSSSFTKEEKINIVLTFLKKHFEISDTELFIIKNLIDFVIDNKQVKKIPIYKKIFNIVCHTLSSKF